MANIYVYNRICSLFKVIIFKPMLSRVISFCHVGLFLMCFHSREMSQELSFLSTNSNLELLSKAIPAKKKQIRDNASKTTVIMISTHLVPSHPSLNLLQQVIQGYQENLVGLPKDAPVIITVDGIKKHEKKNNVDIVDTIENRKIYQEYLQNLYIKFGFLENVRIVVAGINLGLSKMLKKVIDSHIDTNITKFMYLLQHDLKFTKPINHTALIQMMSMLSISNATTNFV